MPGSEKSLPEDPFRELPHILFDPEAVSSREQPVGVQQGAPTHVVPPVVVVGEDLEADHPGPGPVGGVLPADDPHAPLPVLPEPYPTGATEERPRARLKSRAGPPGASRAGGEGPEAGHGEQPWGPGPAGAAPG